MVHAETEDRYNQKLAEAEDNRIRYGFNYLDKPLSKLSASFAVVLFPDIREQPQKQSNL